MALAAMATASLRPWVSFALVVVFDVVEVVEGALGDVGGVAGAVAGGVLAGRDGQDVREERG
jgi:hypothetical protein